MFICFKETKILFLVLVWAASVFLTTGCGDQSVTSSDGLGDSQQTDAQYNTDPQDHETFDADTALFQLNGRSCKATVVSVLDKKGEPTTNCTLTVEVTGPLTGNPRVTRMGRNRFQVILFDVNNLSGI